jgi:serine/threonine protein kinase
MTPERWQQIAEAFEAALELKPEERSTFLAKVGDGDPFLRSELESLLAEDASQNDIPPDAVGGPNMVGAHIGQYQIVRLIGEGGMGAVYEAVRSDQAFDRHVAIKLLRPGLLSRQLIRRFSLERRILGRLNHPNVVALLDAGTTERGQPYLVMEYVDGGVPIDIYCRNRALNVTDRVRMFQCVCDAVQYAHQNLIVHRDLKPQNILVQSDGKVKLLDFGIAKLMRPEVWAGGADLTQTGTVPLTPAYGSPEQVRGELITTASDVYALGVILYELMTDAKPYGSDALLWSELQRVICGVDPPWPSIAARNSTLGGAEGAGQKLARRLSGDLDAIIMMALRKEPDRRYQSALEFREDLDRHLDGRTVRARRGTLPYRAGKLLRRNRLVITAVAAVIAALTLGLITTLTQARIAQTQRSLAERRFTEIRKLADSFLFEFDSAISDLAGATAARQLIVRKALDYLTVLERDAPGDTQLQTELATAYERVGDIQGLPIVANLGDRAGALRSYQEALRIWTAIAATKDPPDDVDTHLALLHRSMGDVLSEDRRHELALREYQAAFAILNEQSSDESQQKVILMGRIGSEEAILGRVSEGVHWSRRAVEEGRRVLRDGIDEDGQHNLSVLYSRAGEALLRAGAIDDAIAMHREEVGLCEKLAAAAPPEKNAHYRRDLALAYRFLGEALLRKDQLAEALSQYERARVIEESLLLADRANAQMRKELSATYSKISAVLTRLGDLPSAEQSLDRQLRLEELLLKDDPTSTAYRSMYSYSLFQMGELLRGQGRKSESRRYYLREAEVLKPVEATEDTAIQRRLLDCYRILGETEDNPKTASAYLNKAADLARRLGDETAAKEIRGALAAFSR